MKLTVCCLLFIVTHLSLAQNLRFTSTLTSSTPYTCQNASVTIQAGIENTEKYVFQKFENNAWQNISSGNSNASLETISYTIPSLSSAVLFRVYIKKSNDSLFSNELNLSPQKPIINAEPLDLIQCNGSNISFKIAASGSGTLTYQWQQSNNLGASFSPLSNSSKYSGVNTATLTVSNLVNSDHNTLFKCQITDANACQNLTLSAKLLVNQLSTVVQPTTSAQFCEGDKPRFFISDKTGNINAYQWQYRLSGTSNYEDIPSGQNFLGTQSDTLKSLGIKISETAFRLKVTFTNLTQSAPGQTSTGTCEKTATRTSYVVNPRPTSPLRLDSIRRCGSGTITVNSQQNLTWFLDSTGSAVQTGVNTFVSPSIIQNSSFYYKIRDTKGCFSFSKTLRAFVDSIPDFTLSPLVDLCQGIHAVNLSFLNLKANPTHFSVKFPAVNQFISVEKKSINEPSFIFPDPIIAGQYSGSVSVENPYCKSTERLVNLKKLPLSYIRLFSSADTVCRDASLKIWTENTVLNPISYSWFKNNTLIAHTDSIRNFQHVSLADAGVYKVIMLDYCGVHTSDSLRITVSEPAEILEQPRSQTVCEGSNLTLRIKVKAAPNLSYKWFRNGTLTGTDSVLTFSSVQSSFQGSKIWCRISTDCEPATVSDTLTLNVESLPSTTEINAEIGYCQGTGMQLLPQSSNPYYTYLWKMGDSTVNQIDLRQAGTLNLNFQKISAISCKSPLRNIRTVISPSFSIRLDRPEPKVCAAGIFNRKADLGFDSSPSDISPDSIVLFRNGNKYLKINQLDPVEFLAGSYKAMATRAYCKYELDFAIGSIGAETPPLPSQSIPYCTERPITLRNISQNQEGNIAWWTDSLDVLAFSREDSILITPPFAQKKYFYSVYKNYQGTYCETERSTVSLSLQDNLKPTISLIMPSCDNRTDGSINYNLENPRLPLSVRLNQNQSPPFSSLAAGTYNFYIQDRLGCNFDTSLVLLAKTKPTIQVQPLNINKCKGNIAEFQTVSQTGLSIQWQRKLPGSTAFLDISGEINPKLRIENIGNSNSPHLTLYRFRLFDNNLCQNISDSVQLKVNSISGTSKTQKICHNSSTELNLEHLHIIGNIKSFQWTFRKGSSGAYVDIQGANSATYSITESKNKDEGFYSNRLIFDLGEGNTCTISSSTVSSYFLRIDSLAKPVIVGTSTVCGGQNATLTASLCSDDYMWQHGPGTAQISLSPPFLENYKVRCSNQECSGPWSEAFTIVYDSTAVPSPSGSVSDVRVGETLRFIGQGQNLMWYTDSLRSNPSNAAPSHTALGTYTYWLSQKPGTCESPLIKLRGSVLPQFQILSSPQDFRNCKGNSATFSITATGHEIRYQWQIKSRSDLGFRNISEDNSYYSGIHTPSLRLYYVGNEFNPDSSSYRCVVLEGQQSIFSNAALLRVNSIMGSLENKTLCLGQGLELDPSLSHVIEGEVNSLNWQFRNGTGENWVEIPSSWNPTFGPNGRLLIPAFEQALSAQLRFSVSFSASGGTCIENSDLMTLKTVIKPIKPDDKTFNFCEGQSNTNWNIYLDPGLDIDYFNDTKSIRLSTKPKLDIDKPGLYLYHYRTSKYEDCPSDFARLAFVVNPLPPKPKSTTELEVEEGNSLQFNAEGYNLKWYTNSTTKSFFSTAPTETKMGEHDYYVSQTDSMGCESERTKIEAKIVTAFKITEDLADASDCEENALSFKIKAKSSEKIDYIWHLKMPGNQEFEVIKDLNGPELKIADVGKYPFVDGSKIMCVVRSKNKHLVSRDAELRVFKLKEEIDDFKICENLSIHKSSFLKYLSGDIFKLNLSIKQGSNFKLVQDLYVDSLKIYDSGVYKIQAIFSASEGTCSRSSSEFKINKIPSPKRLTNDIWVYCESDSRNKALGRLPEYTFLDSTKNGFKIWPENLNTLKDSVWVYQKTPLACTSPVYPLRPLKKVLSLPSIKDQKIELCVASSFPLQIFNDSLLFSLKLTDSATTLSKTGIKSGIIADYQLFAYKKDSLTCLSKPLAVSLKIKACPSSWNNSDSTEEAMSASDCILENPFIRTKKLYFEWKDHKDLSKVVLMNSSNSQLQELKFTLTGQDLDLKIPEYFSPGIYSILFFNKNQDICTHKILLNP
jgi:hypothetical protein